MTVEQLRKSYYTAQDAAIEADRIYSEALNRQYGKNAGDVRYRRKLQTPEIQALGDAYVAASAKSHAAWEAMHNEEMRIFRLENGITKETA